MNVSMIESTNAFRKFAGDKSWDQLTFQQQQQIRLAAILEQAYARYGDKLQNNVMTKQERLMEQLKDIKLNLSQAFLPIWDAILPALTRLAESIAYVTEQLARFTYWLRGWDYDERTQGTIDFSEGLDRVGDSYENVADKAREARKEVAAFDRLNLIGFGSGGGGPGGSGGGTGGIGQPGAPGGGGGEWQLPELPAIPRLQLQFDPPSPPDAGIGAVATAVVATMDVLTAQIRAKWQQALENLRAGVVAAVPAIVSAWQAMLSGVVVAIQSAMSQTQMTWQTALSGMLERIGAIRPSIVSEWGLIQSAARVTIPVMGEVAAAWAQKLAEMLARLKAARPQFESDWYLIRYAARLTVNTVTDVAAAWGQKLGEMLSKLKAARPVMESEWWMIRQAVRLTIPAVTDTQSAWQKAMQAMGTAATTMAMTVLSGINRAIDGLNRLKSALGQPTTPTVPTTAPTTSIGQTSQSHPSLDAMLEGAKNAFGFAFSSEGMTVLGDLLKKEYEKPENQIGLTLMSLLSGGGVAAKGVQAGAKSVLKLLKGWGIAVPAFAAGGVVSGPTLAMVGEYPGARTNPEVIAPLSDLESMLDTSRTNDLLAQILRAIQRGQNITVTISRDAVGRAAKEYFDEESRRGRNPTRRW